MNVVPATLQPKPAADGVALQHGGQVERLRAVWAGEGFPADVERALKLAAERDGHTTSVVTARRLSPGSIRLLDERALPWADAKGNASIITASGIYITRGKPNPLPARATTSMTWSPSATRIVEYVLSRQATVPFNRTKSWNGVDRIAQIADSTHVSPGQVAKVLVSLDAEGYTAKFGPKRGPTANRELRDRSRLLSDWAGHEQRSARREQRANLHVLSRDPSEWSAIVASKLATMRWAMSGWAAADILAPFATTVPDLVLYVPEAEFDAALAALTADDELALVDRGARIHLRSAATFVFDFARPIGSSNVASPVRVYADLLREGGRAAEASEHLREVVIGF